MLSNVDGVLWGDNTTSHSRSLIFEEEYHFSKYSIKHATELYRTIFLLNIT